MIYSCFRHGLSFINLLSGAPLMLMSDLVTTTPVDLAFTFIVMRANCCFFGELPRRQDGARYVIYTRSRYKYSLVNMHLYENDYFEETVFLTL